MRFTLADPPNPRPLPSCPPSSGESKIVTCPIVLVIVLVLVINPDSETVRHVGNVVAKNPGPDAEISPDVSKGTRRLRLRR